MRISKIVKPESKESWFIIIFDEEKYKEGFGGYYHNYLRKWQTGHIIHSMHRPEIRIEEPTEEEKREVEKSFIKWRMK